MKKLLKLQQKLKTENSINSKIEILKQYSECKEYLALIYNPLKQFNLTSKNLIKNNNLISTYKNYNSIIELLNDLYLRKITGNEAIGLVNSFIQNNLEYKELIYNIIDKNLKVKINYKTINKAFNNLIPEFSVALANNFDKSKTFNFNKQFWYLSRKLDGVRLIAIKEKDTVSFFSRDGNVFEVFDELIDPIKNLNIDNVVFDGEVCIVDENGKENFIDMVSQIRKKNHTTKNPKYLIFDMLTLEEFFSKTSKTTYMERYGKLVNILKNSNSKKLEIVTQIPVFNMEDLNRFTQIGIENGWEGVMLRQDTVYKGKRSNDLLKIKKFKDAEFIITGYKFSDFLITTPDGSEVIKTLGSVIIDYKGNNVDVGSGFSLEERQEYYKNPESLIGKTITVKYFEESRDKNGKLSLRFPIKKFIYNEGRNN